MGNKKFSSYFKKNIFSDNKNASVDAFENVLRVKEHKGMNSHISNLKRSHGKLKARYIHAILRLTPKHFWECQIPLFKFRNNFMAQKIIFNQFFRPFASTFFFARVDFWPFWGLRECPPSPKPKNFIESSFS